MKIAVLGGTGFVGNGIVEKLTEKGHTVVVGTRDHSTLRDPQDYKIMQIDYSSLESIKNFIAEQDYVVNCIANVHGKDMSAQEFRRVEVDLTERIAKVCLCKKIPLIQLSSIIAFGRKLPDQAIDDTFIGSDFEMIDRICIEREAIIKSIYRDSADFLILRPVPIIGANDKGSTLKRVFDLYRQGTFPIVDKGLANVTYIDKRDFGEAVCIALDTFEKIKGKTFIIGGFNANWLHIKEAFDLHYGLNQPYSSLTKAEAESNLGYRTAEFISNPRLYDDQNFRKATGFYPKYSLNDAIGYYLNNVNH